jgi:anti-sigma regulatory factor (Ser/Thr protein kinase)
MIASGRVDPWSATPATGPVYPALNRRLAEGRTAMAEATAPPGDVPEVPPLMAEGFDGGRISDVRQAVGRCAAAHGLRGQRLDGFVLAVNEIVTNAVAHGGGQGRLRLWRADAALTCEVVDHGPGLPAEYVHGRHRPPPTALHGRGLWLARQLCDLVSIVVGPQGTTVRLTTALPRSA